MKTILWIQHWFLLLSTPCSSPLPAAVLHKPLVGQTALLQNTACFSWNISARLKHLLVCLGWKRLSGKSLRCGVSPCQGGSREHGLGDTEMVQAEWKWHCPAQPETGVWPVLQQVKQAVMHSGVLPPRHCSTKWGWAAQSTTHWLQGTVLKRKKYQS